jgi:hypothetical protein
MACLPEERAQAVAGAIRGYRDIEVDNLSGWDIVNGAQKLNPEKAARARQLLGNALVKIRLYASSWVEV